MFSDNIIEITINKIIKIKGNNLNKIGIPNLVSNIIIIIIHYLTSDSDPYWAHTDYSLYTYREKTLFKKTL